MKPTPSLSRAVFAASAFLSTLPAMGAVLWVDQVLVAPSTYTGDLAALTDESHGSGLTDITLNEVTPASLRRLPLAGAPPSPMMAPV